MYLGFDHLIFVVHDLEDGARRFTDLGFAITTRHDVEESPTLNRLVSMADGSYVEIVQFRDPAMLAVHRFSDLAKSGGWAEAVVGTDDLTDKHRRVSAAGLPTSPIRTVGKTLAGGGAWEVRLSHLGRGVGGPLMPMVAQDVTSHALRVPDHSTTHGNGASGIAGVTMVSRDPAGKTAGLAALFGTPSTVSGGLRYHFEGRWIDVIEPAGAEHEALLATSGEGIFSVTFGTSTGSFALDGALTRS